MSERLQRVLRQSRPFGSLEQEVLVALQAATARVMEPFARELRIRTGLTPAQYNVLRILRGAGEPGLPCGAIAERMIDRDPDVTRLADRLVRDGLATRDRNPDDRRVVVVRITDEGRARLAAVDDVVAALPSALVGGLGAERLTTLLGLLEDVIESTTRLNATT